MTPRSSLTAPSADGDDLAGVWDPDRGCVNDSDDHRSRQLFATPAQRRNDLVFPLSQCHAHLPILSTAAHRSAIRMRAPCWHERFRTFERNAKVARAVLLHTPISVHTVTALQRDVQCRSAQRALMPIRIKETIMSKGQRGNKEAKKPKKVQSPAKPLSPAAVMPTVTTVVPDRLKKK